MNLPDKESIIKAFKNPKVWQTVVSLVIFAIISLAFFHPDAIEGNSLRQHDMLQGQAIGNETKVFEEQTGEKSWWTNSLFGGMPVYQISPTYSSNALISWITDIYGGCLPAPSNLLFMMMTGFFILMLAMNIRWEIAVLGSLAWAFSSYFVIIIGAGHIWKFVTLAYIPPTIAGVILCYKGKFIRGGAVAAIFAAMQLASNHIQMTYYFLFVILGFVIAYFVKSFKAGELKTWYKATAMLAFAAVLAGAANIPSLYNTYAYSKNSMRGQHSELTKSATDAANATSGLDRNYITQYSYGTSETLSLFIPNIKGGASARPEGGNMVPMSLSSLPEASGTGQMEKEYLQYVSQYFGEPEGTNGPVYVGVIIFALFILGCISVRGAMKWALLALTILSVLLALGRNCMWLTDFFISYVPLYSKFRTVESILVIAEFTIPLLAVLGLQKYVSAENRSVKTLVWSFAPVAVLCLLPLLFPSIYGSLITPQDEEISRAIVSQLVNQGYPASQAAAFSLDNPSIYQAVVSLRSGMIQADALRSIIYLGLAFIALFAFSSGKLGKTVTIVSLAVFVFTDLYTVDKRYVSHSSFCSSQETASTPFPMTKADKEILADTAMNYRVFNLRHFMEAGPSYYHKAIGGYHAAKLTRYQDLIDNHLINFLYGDPSKADYNVANMLNAKYMVMDDNSAYLNLDAAGNAWFARSLTFVDTPDKEMEALSVIDPTEDAVADKRFSDVLKAPAAAPAAGDTIFETSYAPNKLVYSYNASAPSLAVLSEIYYPDGWKADVDGTPVEIGRVNYLLRAVNVPAGKHTLTLVFDPASVKATTTIAYIAITVIYLLVICAIAAALCRKED